MVTVQHRETLGERVRFLRVRSGLTVTALAAKAGISRSYVSEIERGHRNPLPPILAEIARALGVTIADLLDGERS